MSRFSVYYLRPERRYVEGLDSLEAAKTLVASYFVRGEGDLEMEVWDNEFPGSVVGGRPVYTRLRQGQEVKEVDVAYPVSLTEFRDKAIKAQREVCARDKCPHFAPDSGICWSCHRQIYDPNGGHDGTSLVTGCPWCMRSYCD